MFDLDAYLARIGLTGEPDLAALHHAHATSIPFENLDPRRGIPVSLEPDDLVRKLVTERRGGYCFEQNLLLADALTTLGYEVELMLARVRSGGPPGGGVRPRTHLALRVTDDAGVWHCDVGFGLGTPLRPLPFGPGPEHTIDGWRFQLVAEDDQVALRCLQNGAWDDMYLLDPTPVPRVDCVLSNWFTSTFPRSPFVTGLVIAVNAPDGTRVSLSDWSGDLLLTEATPAQRVVTAVASEAITDVVAERFGLDPALLA